MTLKQFLTQIPGILEERERMYGLPEDNLARIAKRWSLTLEHEITPQQVALCMMDVKLARLTHNPWHEDSLKDIIGYAACLKTINEAGEK